MNSVPLGTDLHFHATFDITPSADSENGWGELIASVRNWVVDSASKILKVKNDPDQLKKRWFYTGGEWHAPRKPRLSVTTIAEIGDGTPDAPQYWACRYQHPCRDIPHRQWATDIAITSLSQTNFRFVLTTTYWVLPGYIGEHPIAPNPTAPSIITKLLTSKHWIAQAGDNVLSAYPGKVQPGEMNALVKSLLSRNRRIPIVYLSVEPGSEKPSLDSRVLARCLAGAAVVCHATSTDLDEEMSYFMSNDGCCRMGSVRIYQPGLRDEPDELRKHRFLSTSYVQEKGQSAVIEMIVRGIVRRFRYQAPLGSITSVADVTKIRRERRLQALKNESSAGSQSELLELYEEENTTLRTDLAKQGELVAQMEESIHDAEEARDELEGKMRSLQYERESMGKALLEAQHDRDVLLQQNKQLTLFANLPTSLVEIVDRIAAMHPDSIVFTDEAVKSAKGSDLKDIEKGWACLWAVATKLHRLYFHQKLSPGQIAQEFRSTGFELALTETGLTKNNPRLMALRKVIYKGNPLDMSAHVKFGNKPQQLLRVHFCADPKERRIVVGHCGDHLETSGTRRRK